MTHDISCGKRTVPTGQFPLGHFPYHARLGLELGVRSVGLGLGLVGLVLGLELGLCLLFG